MANGDTPDIIYTQVDEAPELASHSLLPIIRSFAQAADIDVAIRNISLAGRVLSQFPDVLTDEQKVEDDLAVLGEIVKQPGANVIKLPNISASQPQLDAAIKALAGLDYHHRGELGIEGRHAFRYEGEEDLPVHNLYVCIQGAESLRNHLLLRDYLREHPDRAEAYGVLKQQLARKHPNDIDAYIEGKSAFILEILEEQGMDSESLAVIENANLITSQPPRE